MTPLSRASSEEVTSAMESGMSGSLQGKAGMQNFGSVLWIPSFLSTEPLKQKEGENGKWGKPGWLPGCAVRRTGSTFKKVS